MNIPEEIIKAIEKHLESVVVKEKPREPNVFWAVDLSRCIQIRNILIERPELEKLFIEKEKEKARMLTGLAVHKYLSEVLKARMDVEVEPRCERPIRDGILNVKVVGKPDIVLRVDGRLIPVELKAPTRLYSLPRPEHVSQVMIYKWLLDAPTGFLMYFSHRGWKWWEITGFITTDEIRKRILFPKMPLWPGECERCKLKRYCPKWSARRR
ncbi:MAG: hypothetical protein DRP11_02155 [Candidatus Aenigmatarchaeota archaeon]|nr:MAG: hypothetical protein DRP11_02155 [Candidatus Aenigmarchaeota archaeon]